MTEEKCKELKDQICILFYFFAVPDKALYTKTAILNSEQLQFEAGHNIGN